MVPEQTKTLSSVDAAYDILKETKRPMNCKEIVEIALRDYNVGLQGKTPNKTRIFSLFSLVS